MGSHGSKTPNREKVHGVKQAFRNARASGNVSFPRSAKRYIVHFTIEQNEISERSS